MEKLANLAKVGVLAQETIVKPLMFYGVRLVECVSKGRLTSLEGWRLFLYSHTDKGYVDGGSH